MIRPSRARFLRDPRPHPLTLMLPVPRVGTFELYRRFSFSNRPSFLLESANGNEHTARYSFMATDPYLLFTAKQDRYELRTRDQTIVAYGDPFEALAGLFRRSRIPKPEGVPPFFGGAVGYFSYDAARSFETLPSLAVDDLRLPDLHLAFVDAVAAIDHHTDTLHLSFAPPLERLLAEPRDKLYQEGCERLAELEARLSLPTKVETDGLAHEHIAITPNQSRSDYMARVRECQEYIRAGDIYQGNLSHRFTVNLAARQSSPSIEWGREQRNRAGRTLYQRLRQLNPSPFAALLEFDEVCLISSSPERLVRLKGSEVETRPIAGTRPRGQDLVEDRCLAEDLLTDVKERAEHIMLLDLARNDLGRVCRYGTVRVDEFMILERYSHVSHIVSNVTGRLQPKLDGFDLLPAVFPGGTITGVPKIRCMEILERLEPVRRGPYTGSLGYLSWSGDLDLNIIIRTVILTGDRGYLQVGAGIVADSVPAREYDETLHKGAALLHALRRS